MVRCDPTGLEGYESFEQPDFPGRRRIGNRPEQVGCRHEDATAEAHMPIAALSVALLDGSTHWIARGAECDR